MDKYLVHVIFHTEVTSGTCLSHMSHLLHFCHMSVTCLHVPLSCLQFGWTCLHHAAKIGNTELCRILLQKFADPGATNKVMEL